MKKIAILYIIDTLFEIAGSERNLFEIVTRLDPQKYIPVVICMKGGNMVRVLRERGIEVIDLRLGKIYMPSAILKAYELYRFIIKRDIKIVVTYHESSDFFGGIIAWLARVPVIVSSRRDMGYMLHRRHVAAYRIINHLFDRIITVSDAVSTIIAEREKVLWHKLVRIHNGVDREKFSRAIDRQAKKSELGLTAHRPVIGILAALRHIKGHTYFLQAAAKVKEQFPDVYFLVVGWKVGDAYYRELEALTKELGLESNVRFIGGRQDTPEILSLFDISVFASINEGFSNAVIESMAAGKPVVATRSGGTVEAVVDGDTGLLVEPRNADALAEAILRLLKDRKWALQMGENARRRAGETFSIEKMLLGNAELYENLLRGKEAKSGFVAGDISFLTRLLLRTAKQLASAVLYYCGILHLMYQLLPKSSGVKILAYHRVTDSPFVLPGMRIRVANFEKQMRYLSEKHTPLALERALEMIERREPLPANSVVITFDDGYRDNFQNAFPILMKYRIPATVFLSVKAIDEGAMLWFDEILEAFRRTVKKEIDLRDYTLGTLSLRTAAARISAAHAVVSFAKKFMLKERDVFVRNILEKLNVSRTELQNVRIMVSWDEVVKMHEAGVSFGNHGMSHSILSRLTKKELKYEIGKAKEVIRCKTGLDTKLFAYPNGNANDFSQEVEDFLNSYAYTTACTLVKGVNDCAANRLTLRRFCVTEGMESNAFGGFSRSLFAVMLSGVMNL
jgi:glycosyltransferase involved in cell wall biosynthesis/peptidoglycan/xylan/chitin deacetylase (PgdA/CDA1 family)